MNAGFTVWGSDGKAVQVDDTYQNLVLRERGTVVTDQSLFLGGSKVTFTRAGLTHPLMAVNGNQMMTSMGSEIGSGTGQFQYTIMTSLPVGSSVPYFLFDVPVVSDAGFGMQVFSQHGEKTFDLASKYLRVVDVMDRIIGDSTRNYDSSRTYACVHMEFGLRQSSRIGTTAMVSTRINGGTITTPFLTAESFATSPISENARTAVIFVIDVTNY